MQTCDGRRHHAADSPVKRLLLPSKAFLRLARRLAKRNAPAADDLQAALELLAEDAHHPALRTHKLKGKLAKSWACSAGYNLYASYFSSCRTAHRKLSCLRPLARTTKCIEVASTF